MPKILHIAPQNYAGVPFSFYQMHNACGDYARLITLHKNPIKFKEDVCLNWYLPNFSLAKNWRKQKAAGSHSSPPTGKYFKEKNIFERIYFEANDLFRTPIVDSLKKKFLLDQFEIIHFDAGLDFFRFPKQALEWKKAGKKIVCCYYGSDLRQRGIIKELNEISDLNITSEFDHLQMKDDLRYLFYPYDASELPTKKNHEGKKIRIIHSPTNRVYKGTQLIIEAIKEVGKNRGIDFILAENMNRDELLQLKSGCDISIDQVGGKFGGTGYGKAGLETLAMGIPTITNMSDEYRSWLPENPFVVANDRQELINSLYNLIDDAKTRMAIGEKGIRWVEKYHSFKSVNEKLHQLYREKNIL